MTFNRPAPPSAATQVIGYGNPGNSGRLSVGSRRGRVDQRAARKLLAEIDPQRFAINLEVRILTADVRARVQSLRARSTDDAIRRRIAEVLVKLLSEDGNA